jgi:uncharacterized protein (TIGR02596 family)
MKKKTSYSAFSLVEMLVVVAIMALLLVMAVPSFVSVYRARQLHQAGQILADQIMLARQEASTKSRDIEVRIVDLPTGTTSHWRGIQLWIANDKGTMVPMGQLHQFSEAVIIAPSAVLSPLLTADEEREGTARFGAAGDRKWVGFRLRPSIAMDQAIVNPTNNFLTVAMATDVDQLPPANFHTIRINPVTGRVTHHRP